MQCDGALVARVRELLVPDKKILLGSEAPIVMDCSAHTDWHPGPQPLLNNASYLPAVDRPAQRAEHRPCIQLWHHLCIIAVHPANLHRAPAEDERVRLQL